MDYGAFPPEFNSARMYAGPGPESMLVAAAAWNGLAAELRSAAASYESVVSGLTDGSWLGPSSAAMEAAAAPYVEWLNTTGIEAEMTAIQAQAAAGAYQSAFAMTVPPQLIAENRLQLMRLVMTNLFGQNTPSIAMTEAQYGEMWAQDAAAMYTYAGSSAAITSKVKPLSPAPQTTNPAGLVAQGASDTGNTTGAGTQSALSRLINSLTQALQGLSSPGSSTSSGSSTSGLLSELSQLLGGSSSSGVTTTAGLFGGQLDTSSIATSVISQMAVLPAWAGISTLGTFLSPLQTLMTQPISNALAPVAADAAGAAAGAADAAAGAADAAGAAGGAADVAGLAGLGEAASVGGLSVPPMWGWAATAPPGLVGNMPLTLPGIEVGATGGAPLAAGLPMMMGGLPGAAAAGAVGAAAGAAGAKYLPRLSVVARSPAAGYADAAAARPSAKYPVPATFPSNGHAPPGYRPAIVYLPADGQQSAESET